MYNFAVVISFILTQISCLRNKRLANKSFKEDGLGKGGYSISKKLVNNSKLGNKLCVLATIIDSGFRLLVAHI